MQCTGTDLYLQFVVWFLSLSCSLTTGYSKGEITLEELRGFSWWFWETPSPLMGSRGTKHEAIALHMGMMGWPGGMWQGTAVAAAQARDQRPPAANDPENRAALTWFLKSTQTKHL